MDNRAFRCGDRIVHPVYGLGVVEGLAVRDPSCPTSEYYKIRIAGGDLLSVPVNRAIELGVRLISNSLDNVIRCLRSKARPLPDDDRLRLAELKTRSQAAGPLALAQAVRDLLNRGRSIRLTPADHRWLDNACERLSAEIAWVDDTELDHARTAVRREVERFELDRAPAPPKKPKGTHR